MNYDQILPHFREACWECQRDLLKHFLGWSAGSHPPLSLNLWFTCQSAELRLFQPAVPAILTVIKPSARIYSRLVKRKGPEIISACTCEGTKSEARDWHGEEKNAWECIKTEERCSISQQEMISRKVNGLFSPIRPNGLAKSLHINLDLHEEKSLHLQSLTVTVKIGNNLWRNIWWRYNDLANCDLLIRKKKNKNKNTVRNQGQGKHK